MSKQEKDKENPAADIVTEVHQKKTSSSAAAKIILAASAVVSVIFAADGLYIPAAVFGLLLLISCFLPVRKEVQLILSAACGFSPAYLCCVPVDRRSYSAPFNDRAVLSRRTETLY